MKKFLLAFVLGAMLSGGFTYMTVSASPEIYEKQVVTVHTGDTLWDIAADWSGGTAAGDSGTQNRGGCHCRTE